MIINPYIFGSVSAYTPRTTAFASATGIVDAGLLSGLNTYDLAQISSGLDILSFAEYPNVGASAATVKYNFANPLDTDAAFRKSQHGGLTYSNLGVIYNGSNAYEDSKFNAETNELNNNQSYGFFISGIITTATIEFGYAGAAGYSSVFYWNNLTNSLIVGLDSDYFTITTPTFSATGFWLMTRSSNFFKLYKDGVLIYSTPLSGDPNAGNVNIYFGTRGGAIGYWSTSTHQYQWIGKALDATQQLNLYNNVLALQAIK